MTPQTVTRDPLLAFALALAGVWPVLLALAPLTLIACLLFGPVLPLVFLTGLLAGLTAGASLAIRASSWAPMVSTVEPSQTPAPVPATVEGGR